MATLQLTKSTASVQDRLPTASTRPSAASVQCSTISGLVGRRGLPWSLGQPAPLSTRGPMRAKQRQTADFRRVIVTSGALEHDGASHVAGSATSVGPVSESDIPTESPASTAPSPTEALAGLRRMALGAALIAAAAAGLVLAGAPWVHPQPATALTAEIAIGQASGEAAPKLSWKNWLLYKLDLVFAFNPSFKVLSLVLVVVAVTLIGGLGYSKSEEPPAPLGESTWTSWSLLIDAGTQKGQDTAAKRRVAVALTVAGVLFLATLLGLVVEAAGGRLESLKKGRTPVMESGHTLIVGWNSKTVPLARQLMSAYNKANPRQRRPVVVLGDESKEYMDEKIRSAFTPEERARFRIVSRSGSPFSLKDLNHCSAHSASSIIVLAPQELSDSDAADQHVIHAALGVSFRPEISANVVADLCRESSVLMLQRLYDSFAKPSTKPKSKHKLAPLLLPSAALKPAAPSKPATATATATATPSPGAPVSAPAISASAAATASAPAKPAQLPTRRMVPVATGDAALRALVIQAVNPRCAAVWRELLTFDGNEYHFRSWPQLTGQTFGDAMFQFDSAVLCGILRPPKAPVGGMSPGGSLNQLLYCPPPDTVIEEGDRLLFIAEDRDSFRPGTSSKRPTAPSPVPSQSTGTQGPGSSSLSKGKEKDKDKGGRREGDGTSAQRPKQRVLVTGWRREAKAMMELLGSFLGSGSSLTLLDGESISAYQKQQIQDLARKNRIRVEISSVSSSSENAAELASLPLEQYDTVIVLRPSSVDGATTESGIPIDDSATATAMMIRHLQVSRGRSDAQVVAEVTFEESSEPALEALRQASGVNFAMVPEAVQAQVLAQLSEDADVGKLLDRLVGKYLGALEPKSVTRYASPTEEKLSFWDLQDRALTQHNEVIVAWERGGSWVLNPSNKEEKLSWGAEDQIMVIKAGQVQATI